MITVIGVRFRHAGKVYYFSPGAIEVHKGDYVIVETARGVEYGFVVSDPKLASEEDIVPPLRTIIRKADEILVITKNGIQERGTSDQLLKQKGMYYQLYQYQFPDRVEDASVL